MQGQAQALLTSHLLSASLCFCMAGVSIPEDKRPSIGSIFAVSKVHFEQSHSDSMSCGVCFHGCSLVMQPGNILHASFIRYRYHDVLLHLQLVWYLAIAQPKQTSSSSRQRPLCKAWMVYSSVSRPLKSPPKVISG